MLFTIELKNTQRKLNEFNRTKSLHIMRYINVEFCSKVKCFTLFALYLNFSGDYNYYKNKQACFLSDSEINKIPLKFTGFKLKILSDRSYLVKAKWNHYYKKPYIVWFGSDKDRYPLDKSFRQRLKQYFYS